MLNTTASYPQAEDRSGSREHVASPAASQKARALRGDIDALRGDNEATASQEMSQDCGKLGRSHVRALLSATGLLWLAACQLNTASLPGSSSMTRGGGTDAGGGEVWSARRLAVADVGGRSSQRGTADDDDAGKHNSDAGQSQGHGGQNAAVAPTDRQGTGGHGGANANTEPPTQSNDPTQNGKAQPSHNPDSGTPAPTNGGNSPVDAGAADGSTATVGDAGTRPTVEDPIGVLDNLAKHSPQAKTADTINRFLDALAKGGAPASSIREFLIAIDGEVDCKMNPLATECLAACQAVSTTCAACIFDEQCRSTLLEICGVPALAGCRRR